MERIRRRDDDVGSSSTSGTIRKNHRAQSETAVRGERRQMRSTRGNNTIVALGAFACLVLFPLCAQQSGKKSFWLRGKIKDLNTATKRLTVTNEPIEGWMGSMTMGYTVD